MTEGCHTTEDGTLAICFGGKREYLARVRPYGYRKWNKVGDWTTNRSAAMHRMTKAMRDDRHGFYKRADVIMSQPYYDSVQLYELVRR